MVMTTLVLNKQHFLTLPALEKTNREIARDATQKIDEFFQLKGFSGLKEQSFAVFTTGSDGRGEKVCSTNSPVELVFAYSGFSDGEKKKVNTLAQRLLNSDKKAFCEVLLIRDLDNQAELSIFGRAKRCILNSRCFYN